MSITSPGGSEDDMQDLSPETSAEVLTDDDSQLEDSDSDTTVEEIPSSTPGEPRMEKGGVILNIDIPLRSEVELEGHRLVPKAETHATLIGFAMKLDKRYKAKLAEEGTPASNKEVKSMLGLAFAKAAEGLSFEIEFADEYRWAERGEDTSILRMCNVRGADEFFSKLEQKLGFEIEQPPYHVTLYTGENGKGIGIANIAQLEERTRVIDFS